MEKFEYFESSYHNAEDNSMYGSNGNNGYKKTDYKYNYVCSCDRCFQTYAILSSVKLEPMQEIFCITCKANHRIRYQKLVSTL